jgi:DnaK suppressor protein
MATPRKPAAAGKKAATAPKKSAVTKSAKRGSATKKPAASKKAAPAKKAPVKKAVAKATTPARKATTKKAQVRTSPAKRPAAKPVPAKTVTARPAKAGGPADKFLQKQREKLLEERAEYMEKAEQFKAEADQLARENEPGDIQFDEEGGEGGTTNIDRELDLVLSAQARAAVDEIDQALAKIVSGTYGVCERCGQNIPRARLEALPYAALCVQCKSGGLSRR